MLTNFHTHVYRCGHAIGDAFDYVKKAIEEGYGIIGISDHAPLPKYLFDRMALKELDEYYQDIVDCKKEYGKQIQIYAGLEIEYFEDLHDYYEALNEKFDYLILAQHVAINDKNNLYSAFNVVTYRQLELYIQTLMKACETGYFNLIAHPDVFASQYQINSKKDRDLIHQFAAFCEENDVILEFNANGFRRGIKTIKGEKRQPYPYKAFWNIIKGYKIRVIVNSDCHDPSLLNDGYEQKARKLALEWGLNVIDSIF